MKIFNIKNMFTKNIFTIQFIFMIHTILQFIIFYKTKIKISAMRKEYCSITLI